MDVAVPRETSAGERRVATVPEVISRLAAKAITVTIESGAGLGALYDDDSYRAAGATIVPDAEALYGTADVICKVQPPAPAEAERLREGSALICMLQPASNLELVQVLVRRRIMAFSLDLLPRISRAQAMDALSSQATVTGYCGALFAASRLHRFFPMFMTAAGTVPPAKVLVLGAGVAGLQAIATAPPGRGRARLRRATCRARRGPLSRGGFRRAPARGPRRPGRLCERAVRGVPHPAARADR